VSGLPSDRFFFAGFPPAAAGARAKWLAELRPVPATLILYESPKRIRGLLDELLQSFGDRQAAVCRELTKRFEEVVRGKLSDLVAAFSDRVVKGEIVLLIDREQARETDAATLDAALRAALTRLSVKDAAAEVAATYGLPKREVYQAALKLEAEE
jgi:16S rRNA (cytidine1402-2'-O)-methyltransferase